MHIYFAGLGGAAIGPLALLARDGGYEVDGSDASQSRFVRLIEQAGIAVGYDQSGDYLRSVHARKAIDWFVHTAALPADHPELAVAKELGLRISKRDEFINKFLVDKKLKLIAVSGTHGKTTATAMLVWLFKQMGTPVSYSLGTDLTFGPSAAYQPDSVWFVYEADEYDRNMLKFIPEIALITEVDFDHPDTYKDVDDYRAAFEQFARQAAHVFDEKEVTADRGVTLPGTYNRLHATMAVEVYRHIFSKADHQKLIEAINRFPGSGRRFEKIRGRLYSDYAHHPAEIRVTLALARETNQGKHTVAVYQPHQNLRQHEMAGEYQDCFEDADQLYWLPTYLSREDKTLPVLTPEHLIAKLTKKPPAQAAQMDDNLAEKIKQHLDRGDLVVAMTAGDLDDWLRQHFA